MKKTILEIYALAVCFMTVTCFVICLGIAGYSLVQVSKPEFTMNTYEYDRFQSNEAFWRPCFGQHCDIGDNKRARPSEEELTKQRTEAYARAVHSEQRSGGQTLVKTLIVMLVDALAFWIHWVIARRARATAS